MEHLNKYFKIGLVLVGISLFSKQFDLFPHFVEAMCLVMGCVLEILGILMQHNRLTKIRQYKKRLFKKYFMKWIR
ncbi:MAG: hypothetical protein ACRCST_09515 [Turicibacter sp.]